MARSLSAALLALALLSLAVGRARAHDPGLSALTVIERADGLSLQLVVRSVDLTLARRDGPRGCLGDGVIAEVQAGRAHPVALRCRPLDDAHTMFEGTLTRLGSAPSALSLTLLEELPRGHRTYVRIVDEAGAVQATRMLARAHEPLHVTRGVAAQKSFFVLGLAHIAGGFDHLLFLTVLLIGVDRLRRMVQVVSAFTFAHSLTLALATLGWLRVPAQLVEATIAASIVVVALRSCLGGRAQAERLSITFVLGLVHGLGFASALHDLGVAGERWSIVVPLLAFNAGVEAGQLAFGALAVPLLLWVRRSGWLAGQLPRLLSGLAALAGLAWLLQRTT